MLFQSKRRALGHASLTAGLAAAALALLAPVTAHAAPPDDVGPNAVPAAASAQTAIPLPSAIPFARPAAAGQPALRTGPVAAPPTNPAVVTVPDGATAPSLATDALVQITLIQGGSSAAQTSYNVLRAQLATIVGFQLGRDPAAFEAAWSAADLTHQTALMAAFSQIGTPYHSGQSNPGKGFDCSGLTSFAWGVAGVGIPRSSGTQIARRRREPPRPPWPATCSSTRVT